MQKILTGVALLVGGVGLTWAMAGNGPARQPDQPCTNASHTACTHDHAHGWTSVLPYVEPPVDQLTDDAIRNYGRTPPNIEFNPYLVQHGIMPWSVPSMVCFDQERPPSRAKPLVATSPSSFIAS